MGDSVKLTQKTVCAVCGKGPPHDDMAVHRVNVKGEPGIWACRAHGVQAINNLASIRGADAVLEEHQHLIKDRPDAR